MSRNTRLQQIAKMLPIIIFCALTGFCLSSFRQQAPKTQKKNSTVSGQHSFMLLSDIHLDASAPATSYGGDTGNDLWEAFLTKAGSILSSSTSPDFIIYTGDLPAHYSCNGTCYLPPDKRETHNKDLTTILSGLHSLSEKYHKPLFYLPGNNDALAGDYYSFADEKQLTPLSVTTPTPGFFPGNNTVSTATPPCMVSNPNPGLGYYAAYPVRGLRLIALNTVIYNAKFKAVDGTTQMTDGNLQMEWLSAQLADAASKKEKVYIAMHVPPGTDAYSGRPMWKIQTPGENAWLNTFLTLTAKYQNTISGIFYGHTHMDEVRRLYDSTGRNITTVAISCPGVTPQHNNNPGFKTVQYNPSTMDLVDFTTYYTHPGQPVWGDSSYTFSKTFAAMPGKSIHYTLSHMTLPAVARCMNEIYTVKNGIVKHNVIKGIEVKQE